MCSICNSSLCLAMNKSPILKDWLTMSTAIPPSLLSDLQSALTEWTSPLTPRNSSISSIKTALQLLTEHQHRSRVKCPFPHASSVIGPILVITSPRNSMHLASIKCSVSPVQQALHFLATLDRLTTTTCPSKLCNAIKP